MKKHEAVICSMTKKERKNPNLLIQDKTSRSRQLRIGIQGKDAKMQRQPLDDAPLEQVDVELHRTQNRASTHHALLVIF